MSMIRFRFDGQAINENDTPDKVIFSNVKTSASEILLIQHSFGWLFKLNRRSQFVFSPSKSI